MEFETYLNQIPMLHTWDGGQTWNAGGFDPLHLRAFRRFMGDSGGDLAVIETGAGNSTITFLFGAPRNLVSIALEAELFGRIEGFCASAGVSLRPLEKYVGRSEWALPRLAADGRRFGLALIDGHHGWPNVFVDFCYLYAMLDRGGILVVDDVQLHSIKELARLLARDVTRFELVADLGKSLAFRKLTDETYLPEWNQQPYIVERSEKYERSPARFSLFPYD